MIFTAHVTVVLCGLGLALWNLADAVADFRTVRGPQAARWIAIGWVVREVLHVVIQGVFLSFAGLYLADRANDVTWADHHWARMMDLRALWISTLVLLLSVWNRTVRALAAHAFAEHPKH